MALSLNEQADAMRVLKSYPADDLQELLTTFDIASVEQCVHFLRRLIVEWRKNQAARNARAAEPPPPDVIVDGDAIGHAIDPQVAYEASVEALRAAQAEQERAAQEHAAQLASAVAAASSPARASTCSGVAPAACLHGNEAREHQRSTVARGVP